MSGGKKPTAAVIPGSFDPVTIGHLDVIARAAALFDTVYVTVFRNAEKAGMFTIEEKLHMLRLATASIENVYCSADTGLLADFAVSHGAGLVKGVRSGTDFDYEMSMYSINRAIEPTLDTIWIPAKQEYFHVSSSYVREMIRYGHDYQKAVPEAVYEYLQKEWKKKS